jgi:hypothetical protein
MRLGILLAILAASIMTLAGIFFRANGTLLLSMRLSSRSGSKYGAVIVAPDGTQEAEPTQYQPHQTYSQSFIQRSKVFS